MPKIIEKPKTIIDSALLEELHTFSSDNGQVIVHGICHARDTETYIRIWPTTFLFDQHSLHLSELVHYEKISGFPIWTHIKTHSTFAFTLVFTGLPSTCKIFDLVEVIPQSQGFFVPNIIRNEQDVYYLDFSG